MKVVAYVLLFIAALLAVLVAVNACRADYGVMVEERIVNLPQDQGKWYISVVGNDAGENYHKVLGWFDSQPKLRRLKNQIHFCPVIVGTPVYQERYANNVKSLPTVRLQKPTGVVVYEAAGKHLPASADGLYSALAQAVFADANLIKQSPWKVEQRCPLRPKPQPEPEPGPNPDPPAQPLDNVGPPVIDEAPAVDEAPDGLTPLAIILIVVACIVVGGSVGLVSQWRKTY